MDNIFQAQADALIVTEPPQPCSEGKVVINMFNAACERIIGHDLQKIDEIVFPSNMQKLRLDGENL